MFFCAFAFSFSALTRLCDVSICALLYLCVCVCVGWLFMLLPVFCCLCFCVFCFCFLLGSTYSGSGVFPSEAAGKLKIFACTASMLLQTITPSVSSLNSELHIFSFRCIQRSALPNENMRTGNEAIPTQLHTLHGPLDHGNAIILMGCITLCLIIVFVKAELLTDACGLAKQATPVKASCLQSPAMSWHSPSERC